MTTKYDIATNVWVMHANVPVASDIMEVRIRSTDISYGFALYESTEYQWRDESLVFTTKDELINSLR